MEIPFWGRRFGEELVQVITAPEWVFFKDKGYIKGMDKLTEDDNPVVVVAKLKNSDK